MAASDGAAIHLLDGTSGATLASASLTAHALALSSDGSTLVTRHEDVLRVWDVAALRRGRPTRLRGAHEGWIDAAFSPNGQRLITGKLLCDGRDGRLVARLALDGPGALEGGPPVNGRAAASGIGPRPGDLAAAHVPIRGFAGGAQSTATGRIWSRGWHHRRVLLAVHRRAPGSQAVPWRAEDVPPKVGSTA